MLDNGQKLFHEQETIRDRTFQDTEPIKEQEVLPIWPPPPRPKAAQGPPPAVKVLAISLALLLVVSGLGFIIFTANNQYGLALGASRSVNVNATVSNEMRLQATVVRSMAQTAQPLATAQAQIEASATAQVLPTTQAQDQENQATETATTLDALLSQDTSGTPDLDDPLTDNSLNNEWDTVSNDNNASGCNFVDGEYSVQEVRPDFLQACFADATNFTHFVYQITMTINSGNEGGVIFRANQAKGQYYLFRIDTNGTYALDLYNGSNYTSLLSGTSDAIETGAGESNSLSIIADKNSLSLFVNEEYIASENNHTLSAGEIGVAAINTEQPTSVDFTEAEVWKLP